MAKKTNSIMLSPDLFSPNSRFNVYSIQTGILVGSIVTKKNGEIIARKVSGAELIFTDDERAKAYLRNEQLPPIAFTNDVEEEQTNPNQTSLF